MRKKIETKLERTVQMIGTPPPPREAPALMYGPLRRAPMYWAGETFGKHIVQYPDVERRPNGTVPSVRNKAARRVIRKALKRRFSRVESALRLPRAMQAQALELVRESFPGKSRYSQNRRAKKLYELELAIHQPVYAPSAKELRKIRTAKRRDLRNGKVDAISALVDRMAQP